MTDEQKYIELENNNLIVGDVEKGETYLFTKLIDHEGNIVATKLVEEGDVEFKIFKPQLNLKLTPY